jgi:translation initiation factor 2B subunit (eIF-2B alpha/beta/delta family)
MTDTNKNYSKELTAKIIAVYSENPNMATVNTLADTTGKTVRSLIAKLSREGVYQKKERTTKSGLPVITKEDLVKKIAEKQSMDFSSISSLVKATKSDLEFLFNNL